MQLFRLPTRHLSQHEYIGDAAPALLLRPKQSVIRYPSNPGPLTERRLEGSHYSRYHQQTVRISAQNLCCHIRHYDLRLDIAICEIDTSTTTEVDCRFHRRSSSVVRVDVNCYTNKINCTNERPDVIPNVAIVATRRGASTESLETHTAAPERRCTVSDIAVGGVTAGSLGDVL